MTKPRRPAAHPIRSAPSQSRSRAHALPTGIDAPSLLITGEDLSELEALIHDYFGRFQPEHPEQRDLVDILIRSTWTLRRLTAAESQIIALEIRNFFRPDSETPIGHAFKNCDRTLTRLHRIINSTQRNYREALRELERLDSRGPEDQPTAAAATPEPAEPQPPRRQPQPIRPATPPDPGNPQDPPPGPVPEPPDDPC